ncbi:MAG: hypothetical protein HPY69_11650 [Armatimonadetes bacterium]|nr:hypothetical protein [Armatimonadota bacterium]
MRKDQLIIVALIVVCGIGLVVFGRTRPGPDPYSMEHVREALLARKVPLHVIIRERTPEGKQFLKEVKEAIAGTRPQRVQIIVTDVDDPNERPALEEMQIREAPAVAVLGLDGQLQYYQAGGFDQERLRHAIEDGLKRPPIRPEDLGAGDSEGHHH